MTFHVVDRECITTPQPIHDRVSMYKNRFEKRDDKPTSNGNRGEGRQSTARSYYQSHHTHLRLSVLVLCALPGFVLDYGFFPRLRRLPGAFIVFKAFGGCLFQHPSQYGLRVRRLEHPRLGGNDTGTLPPTVPAAPPAAAGVAPCAGAAVVPGATLTTACAPATAPAVYPKAQGGGRRRVIPTTAD